MNPFDLLNRPMLEDDLAAVATDPWTRALRRLAAEYRQQGLVVANGELLYSNLLEGAAQVLTCHPYRLWEYVSLFQVLGDSFDRRRFLDVGGAGSILPCLLAEHGGRGVALELQPLLVALSRQVSRVQGVDLHAEVADAATVAGHEAEFDFATCVSVLEHVPPAERPRLLRNVHRMLRPRGFLYLTFDYGTHVAAKDDQPPAGRPATLDESLTDIAPLCASLEEAGFVFIENDPRELPAQVLARKSAPRHAAVARRMALNRPPFDAETPWSEIGRYLARRLGLGRRRTTRYARHNFFRLFVRKV